MDTAQISYALNTFYILVCGTLVMFMACGFAMLEAGLVRSKNTTEILTKNIALYAVACCMFLLVGYHIAFQSPESAGSWIPGLSLLIGDEHTADVIAQGATGVQGFSARAMFFFQVVFCATSMSVVSGAVAERMKLWSFLLFAMVMTGFIYPVSAFWQWGGGALSAMGFKDFAGSGVVHLTGASAALAGVLILGPRAGKYGTNGQINAITGANIPLASLGALILWFGWFGFNGGSELAIANFDEANKVSQVFVNTNAAACGGLIAALAVARLLFKTTDLTMGLNGALAGLVAITAEPLTPTAELSTLIGAIGGAIVVFAILAMDRIKIDDPVGAISVHGCGGIWGLLAVCLSNPQSKLVVQLTGIMAIFLWVFFASLVVWLLIKFTIGIRVSREEEIDGMDLTDIGLEAYPEFSKKARDGR